MSQAAIPEGFQLFAKDQSFNDAIAPLYFKFDGQVPTFAMVLEKHSKHLY